MPLPLVWTASFTFPLLGVIQLFPLFCALLIYLLRGRLALPLAFAATVIELLLVVLLFQEYQRDLPMMQFAEELHFIGPLNYHAAVDGISILFMLLTALLTLLATIYAPLRQLTPYRALMPVLLLIESATMSIFTTVDLLWFVLGSTVQLLAIGYLLWFWATSSEFKDLMFVRFMQFMAVGLLLLLAGSIALAWHYSDSTGYAWSFDLFDLTAFNVSAEVSSIIFFLMFYGFAVRIPLFPMHGWLPLSAEHGNIAAAPIFLVGLKTGVYGLVRFVLPILPEASMQWSRYIAAFAMAGIFYAALLATIQNNIRRLLAYAVVSHTSFLMIGLFTLKGQAFAGAVLAAVNLGFAVSALLFVSGFIYRRTGTMLLDELGGLYDVLPMAGLVFLVAGLSVAGMPGTPGFDAVHLLIEASIEQFGALLTIAAALGNVIAAGFLLWAFQRAFLASSTEASHKQLPALAITEWLICLILIFVLIAVGFFSSPWLELLEAPVRALEQRFELFEPIPAEIQS